MQQETIDAIRIWNALVEMPPGENAGCVAEPEVFKETIAEMPDATLRELLNNMCDFLYFTRKLWEKDLPA